MIKLSVTDESEGIDPRHLPRLTERFYRVDSGRSRSMGGTGLGIAIVMHIVERPRGRMEIMSTPGKGTTITVHIPSVAEATESTPLSLRVEERHAGYGWFSRRNYRVVPNE